MIRGVRGLIGAVLVGVLLISGAPVARADPVTIADAALRSCVERGLRVSDLPADFTEDNLAKLSTLACNATDGVLGDVSSMAKLTGLTVVSLPLSAEVDLSALASLPRLTYLVLILGSVSRVDLPSGLRLTNLVVSSRGPQLPTTSALVARSVYLAADKATSLDGLGPVVADTATIYGGKVTDVRALARSAIADLTLLPARDASLDGLGDLTGLLTLSLPDPPASYAGLAGQSDLRTLKLGGPPQLSDLETLPNLPELRTLEIAGRELTRLPDLSRFPGLTSLTVDASTRLTSLGPPGSLKALEKIRVWYAGLSDIRALTGATGLDSVELQSNQIADLSPLAGLQRASLVNLRGNRISDVSPLAGLAAKILDLGANRISNIAPLADLPDGTTLRLENNQITDFSPLRGWTGTLAATNQWLDLPDATVGIPYPLTTIPRGADGAELPVFRNAYTTGTLTGRQFLYTEGGWSEWPFRNAASEQAATISVRITQSAVWGPPFASIPKPVVPTLTVGRTATATIPAWTPRPASYSYQWHVGGVAVPGATGPTFTPGLADAGKPAFLEVVGRKPGYLSATVYSNVVTVTPLRFPQEPTVRITPTKDVRVGTVLKAVASWPKGAQVSYRWRVGAALVDGGPTYTVRPADAAKPISVQLQIDQVGYETTSVTSTTRQVRRGTFANVAPKISGTRKVGKVLTATTVWPSGTKLGYRWYRNGVSIRGATHKTYTLKSGDRGKRFRVKVTATRPGYEKRVKFSATTKAVRRG